MISYERCVVPYYKNFKGIKIKDSTVPKIKKFVQNVVKEKKKEQHHRYDRFNEEKRFYTGTLGEVALEEYFDVNFVDWTVGNSNKYNISDLKSLGLNVGIKTVEHGKFPIIHKNPKRPEIILLKVHDSGVILCGLATVKVMKKFQSDDLILSPNLRKRGTKTGFYGFEHLLPFGSLEELKEMLTLHSKKVG